MSSVTADLVVKCFVAGAAGLAIFGVLAFVCRALYILWKSN